MFKLNSPFSRSILASLSGCLLLLSASLAQAGDDDLYQNLEPLEGAKAALAEIDPNVDFSVYRRIAILETTVAFRSGWEREQRRTGSRIGISQDEVDKIKTGVAETFEKVLIEVLRENEGYELVQDPADDVLLLRTAIIDLDITAPDTGSSFNSYTFTTNTGSATVYVELYDSVSGQILARAADRETIQNAGDMLRWSTKASNRGDAERLFRTWAEALRTFFDKHLSG